MSSRRTKDMELEMIIERYCPDYADHISRKTASHLPLLIACIQATSGPVLELGCGYGSTIALHRLCVPAGRRLLSMDNSASWLNRFRTLAKRSGGLHRLKLVEKEWGHLIDIFRAEWDVAFVDMQPGDARSTTVMRLKKTARLIVAHDTQPNEKFDYGYEPCLASFRFRVDDRSRTPATAAVSDTVDVGAIWFK